MMEYYSLIKMDDSLSFEIPWMELEVTMFYEISQAQNEKCCIISLTCGI
jgi:hypothetical protein